LRNEQAGRQLADVCGYRWVPELGDICPPMLVNVTPIGMAGGPEAEAGVSEHAIAAAERVFDVVAMPAQTPLIRRAQALGKPVITGLEVIALQALEQFVLYTGVRPTRAQVDAAVAYARASWLMPPLHSFGGEGVQANGSEHLVPVIQLLVDQCPAMGQRHMLRILKVGEELHRHRHALAGVPVGAVIRQPAA
jgi:hypothetical protein